MVVSLDRSVNLRDPEIFTPWGVHMAKRWDNMRMVADVMALMGKHA